MIRRDQKIPVIWFVANVGGILGLCMGCSLVTIFEVLHHIILIFLRTGVKSVNRIHKTIRCVPRPQGAAGAGQNSGGERPSGLTMAAFMQMGSNLNIGKIICFWKTSRQEALIICFDFFLMIFKTFRYTFGPILILF